MSASKPEFHLQRVNADGTSTVPEIYQLLELPANMRASRRGFVGTGLAAVSVLGLLKQASSAIAAPAPQPAAKLFAHHLAVRALAVSGDGKWLASASDDATVKLWSLPHGRLVRTLKDHKDAVTSLVVSPDNKLLATGSDDRTIKLWSLADGKLLHTITGFAGPVWSLAIYKDKLISGSNKDPVRFWSLPAGESTGSIAEATNVWALAVNPKTGELSTTSLGPTIKVWSLPDGEPLNKFTDPTHVADAVWKLVFSPNGAALATAHQGGNDIALWSLADGLLRTLEGHQAQVSSLAMTPDGSVLISGSDDKTIRLWSLADGLPISIRTDHAAAVMALTVSPDGKTLVSGDADGTIILWSKAGQSYLYDPVSSPTDAYVYTTIDAATGLLQTFTLPCGTPLPAGATCTCNCVPSTYAALARRTYERPDGQPTLAPPEPRPSDTVSSTPREPKPRPEPRPRPVPIPKPERVPRTPPPFGFGGPPMGGFGGGGGGNYGGGGGGYSGGSTCTCNKICICIPVCQAHRLLHPERVVRQMAEELLLTMGQAQFAYMKWAANLAPAALRRRIGQMMDAILCGARPEPARWPTPAACIARLSHPDEVVRIMAAQLLSHEPHAEVLRAHHEVQPQVERLLLRSSERVWTVQRRDQ